MYKIQYSTKKTLTTFYFLVLAFNFFGQDITQKLQKAFSVFEKDSQLKYAISSLYVIDANTGEAVFDKNSRVGLAPASTQKIITSVTAFELLGKDYKYQTDFFYTKNDKRLVIIPGGDPTFGSWRWADTNFDSIASELSIEFKKNKISGISNVFLDNSGWGAGSIPDGWIWQDIGNYYGAGAHKLNYRENQYEIVLKSGKKIGDSVSVVSVNPSSVSDKNFILNSKLTSAVKGSGDNAYVYLPDDNFREYLIRGTIPVNEDKFTISASITNPGIVFSTQLLNKLREEMKFGVEKSSLLISDKPFVIASGINPVYIHYSPSLDSIIYWFNKKSINLYGEALLKTMAYETKGAGSTDSGVLAVKNFWKQNGMDEDELNIVDGSGLSPLNRITTHAQVGILKYAKGKVWFPYFYKSLPEFNGMIMKSGTIRGVKGFCGYHKAKNGKEYIFSFLVNNYKDLPSSLVNKMYKVLDVLK